MKKSRYWLSKDRRLELEHFCRQYSQWEKALACVDGMAKIPQETIEKVQTSGHQDPTAKAAETREYYTNRMDMVRRCSYESGDSSIAPYIFKAATEGISYDILDANYNVPCGRRQFYKRLQIFYWHLSNLRK